MVDQEFVYTESEIFSGIADDKPLQEVELLTLLMLATKHGYEIKAARDMKSQYDEVLDRKSTRLNSSH